MTDQELFEQQKKLLTEAELIIQELALLRTIQKIGDGFVVGSVELGLMTWRSIDIEVVEKKLSRQSLIEIITAINNFPIPQIEFTIIDNTIKRDPHIQNSLYLGIKYPSPSDNKIWTINLYFRDQSDSRSLESTLELKNRLNDRNKLQILRIKSELAGNPKFGKEILSLDVYNAVLDNGVTNLKEFKDYLKTINKSL